MKRAGLTMRAVVCIAMMFLCLIMAGCPPEPSSDYHGLLEDLLYNSFQTDFDSPIVRIDYEKPDGTKKTAEFALDDYDAKTGIGYKLVTSEDKTIWENLIAQGDTNVPDLGDYQLIQKAALKYTYPVIFIRIDDFSDKDWDAIIDNQETLADRLNELLASPEMIQWSNELKQDDE